MFAKKVFMGLIVASAGLVPVVAQAQIIKKKEGIDIGIKVPTKYRRVSQILARVYSCQDYIGFEAYERERRKIESGEQDGRQRKDDGFLRSIHIAIQTSDVREKLVEDFDKKKVPEEKRSEQCEEMIEKLRGQ